MSSQNIISSVINVIRKTFFFFYFYLTQAAVSILNTIHINSSKALLSSFDILYDLVVHNLK